MSSRRSDIHGSSSISSEDNVDEAHHTYGVYTRFRVTASNLPRKVPSISTNPTLEGKTHAQSPQGDITNAEFCRSIHLLTQLVTSQSQQLGSAGIVVISSEATRVGQFMRFHPPIFTGTKV